VPPIGGLLVAGAGVHQYPGLELPLGVSGAAAVAGGVGFHATLDIAEDRARQEAPRGRLEVLEAEEIPEAARDVAAVAPRGNVEVGVGGVGRGGIHRRDDTSRHGRWAMG
jgi:hypothetical protein